MEELIRIGLITLICIPVGILLGNSAVYIFNKMPAQWLCDYGETPTAKKFIPGRQRLNSHPWKLAFSAMFICVGIFLCLVDITYAVPALVQMWLLLMIAIADEKYMIIPDQFVIFLALASIGIFMHFGDVKGMVLGAAAGAGIMLAVALAGRIITKTETLGFGDVKLVAAIGLTTGVSGIGFVLITASFLSFAVFAYKLLKKRIRPKSMQPLGPYIAAATAVFLIISV